jgi:hypothetical protein
MISPPVGRPEEWDLLEVGKVCLTITGLLMEAAEGNRSWCFPANRSSSGRG